MSTFGAIVLLSPLHVRSVIAGMENYCAVMQQQEGPSVAPQSIAAQEDLAPSDRQDFAAEMRARAQAKRKAVVPEVAPVSMPQLTCLLDMTSCYQAYRDVNFGPAWHWHVGALWLSGW